MVCQGPFASPSFPTNPYICVVSVCSSRGEIEQSGECTGILKEVPELSTVTLWPCHRQLHRGAMALSVHMMFCVRICLLCCSTAEVLNF